MGNSGSVHHMQSGLKELHTYYQVQSNDDDGGGAGGGGLNDFSFLKHEHKLSDKSNPLILQTSNNRLKGSTSATTSGVNSSHHHIKVLPSLSENLRLRSTTNGAILNSGGTISGRRESLFTQPKQLLMERSRTFITENSEDCMNRNLSSARVMAMQRRSQTQLDIDTRKRNPDKILAENDNYKRYSSNLDLRRPFTMNENLDTHSNETYQKLSKVKIKTKKRKAPPVPPSSSQILPIIIDQSNDLERKQRIFKTKTETTVNHSRQQLPIKRIQRDEEVPVVVMRSNLISGFRREKSFDGQLLTSELANSKRGLIPSIVDTATKRKSLQLSKSTTLTPVIDNKMERSDFKMKLEVPTKFRSRSMTKTTELSTRQRDPTEEKRKLSSPPSRVNRPETQSKIPQLKKTFYFGMENSKRKPLLTRMMPNDSSRKIANPTSLLDETITTTNSSSKDHDEFYLLNRKYDSKEIDDNGIQLNVRPTLPRRQLEIPRFSPVAAWKTLSAVEEQRKEQHLNSTTSSSPSPTSLNAAIETVNTFIIEDRIHRTYRDPCPFYPDNKSGDSGISGDDGYIVEKPIQPQNLEHVKDNFCDELAKFESTYPVDELGAPPIKVVGPFLSAWTPQQDLEDEEDSSSDGSGGEFTVNMSDSQTPTSRHVFSLSLPRENQLAVYGEKMDFRSLQKIKRTTSSDLNNGINGDCNQSTLDSQHNFLLSGGDDVCLGNNYRSDNWVLSKTTGKTAVFTHPNNDPKNSVDRIDSPHVIEGSNYFDLSASVQPMSLGSLATGKHVMYLPNRTTGGSEFKRKPATVTATVGIRPPGEILINKHDNSLEDLFCKNIPMRSKRFSFQSSVRQIERRRLSEKLSKEADQKEALRKSELEAMRRVEEEFQKKRANEKASIRQQLRLYSMDDDNFMSLPNLNDYRAEPDGAVSSSSELSAVLQIPTTRRNNL